MRKPKPNFYITGGTLPRDASSYIERSADEELLSNLRSGEFCYVLTSRQMGKSSLMVKTVARLRQENVVCAVIDLTAIGQILDVERWYGGILNRVAEQLEMELDLEEFWFSHSEMGPLDRFMHALREVVLRAKSEDIVIFIDEIDAVRSLPFSADEFFAAIRSCYNLRTEDSEYERLTFCLIGVASPTDLIRDTRTTPFNIGKRIDLTDFSLEESLPLAGGMSSPNSGDLLNRVMYWTAGHPYLTQRLCQAVAADVTVKTIRDVDRVCSQVFFSAEAREQNDNLLFVRDRLLRSEVDLVSLLETYQAALSGKEVRNNEANPVVSVLRLAGIVRVERGLMHPRNRIYSAVFDRKWVSSNLPGEEVRRQRAAYRRGVFRVTAVAGVVVLALSSLALYAFSQRNLARLSEAKAIAAGKLERQARIEADQNAAGRTAALKEANKQKGIAQNRAAFALGQSKLAAASTKKFLTQKLIADSKATEANKNLLESQRMTYIASMQSLQAAAASGNSSLVESILERPDIRTSKFRGWEWGYWDREYHLEITVLKGHTDRMVGAAFSPDGLRVLTASSDGTARTWDARTGGPLINFKGHSQGLHFAELSPDGSRVVTGTWGPTAKMWDARTGKGLADLKGHKDEIRSAKFSPDGFRIVTASEDQTARVWDGRSGKSLFELSGHKGPLRSAKFSPDGKRIVTASTDRAARVWDASTGRTLFELKGHTDEVTYSEYSRDGSRIVTASADGTARVWDAATGTSLMELRGHTSAVNSAAFSEDGTRIVTSSDDHTSRVWISSTGTNLAELKGHTDRVYHSAFSPDGTRVLTASRDGTARVWDASTGVSLFALKGHSAWVMSAEYSPDGSRIVTASTDRTTRIWDSVGQSFTVLKGHTDKVRSAAFSPDSSRIVTASLDRTVKVWDASTGRALFVITRKHPVWSAVFSPSRARIVTTGGPTAGVWDASTGRSLFELKGHTNDLNDARYSPDGSYIVTASVDNTARIWNAATGRCLAVLKGHTDTVYTAAYSPDSSRIVTASFDTTARVWDAATGRCLFVLNGHTGRVYDAAFSPDGLRIVTASFDRTAKVWDISTGKSILELVGHGDEVYSAAFSPDGQRILTASGDKTARIWDAATGMSLVELKGHTDRVRGAAFSPDGTRIVTVSQDKTAIIWYSKRKDRLLTRTKK